jgi:hypothetical protein
MNTRDDITEDEQLTISLCVSKVIEIHKGSLARKVILEDCDGAEVPLVIFQSNDCAEFEWMKGNWYKLKNAEGNYYEEWDELQLVPSWDFGIVPLDDPPTVAQSDTITGKDATAGDNANTDDVETPTAEDDGFQPASTARETGQTTADGGAALARQTLTPGNYLLHFPLGDLSGLEVHVYDLDIPGGLDPSDEDLENGVMGFTARAAARFRYQGDAPVTTNGPLTVYAVETLHDELRIDGYTVQPVHQGTETLEAQSFDDQEPLRELVKLDVKAALRDKYVVNAINSIVEFAPQIKATSGDFTAAREYKCRIWVDPDGTVVCGVNVGFHLASTFSAAEYVRRGYDIEGVSVEHDTEVYDNPATGVVSELSDTGYTERVPEMGSSIAAYHRETEYVEEDVVESVAAGEPVMAHIDFGSFSGLQALDYCRVVPTLDQLKLVDPDFHERFQRSARMYPDERYSIATSFVKSLGETPTLGLEPAPQPSNNCYNELAVDTQTNNLRFGNGQTASYGARGLSKYGVHQAPDSFDLLALYPEQYEEDSREFVRGLLTQLNDYDTNATRLNQEAYHLGSEFAYTQVANQATDYDGVIAVVPDPDWIDRKPDIDDPYPEFKRQFGQEKLPSQMVRISNLQEEDYLGNIASGLVAKCGGIPWRIHEVPGQTDVFIGLDVTYDHETGQHLGASANVVLADGTILASQSVSLQGGETFDIEDIADIIKNLLTVFLREEDRTPRHVIIHRDGQFYLDVDELVDRLEQATDLIPKFDLVEIRKSGNPRIAEYTGDTFEVTNKGTGFVARHADHAYLATTGTPERLPGTPRPIRIVKRHGSTDLGTLVKQAYWLSEAHVGSISRSTRLPITTYYADRCAEHARQGYLLNGELIRGVPYV